MNYAFQFDDVSAGYAHRTVLENLNFAVREGEMVAVLGPNGAGKSTLLQVLTGFHPLQFGRVRLFGKSIQSFSCIERARLLAVVPQDFNTPMAYTVGELIMMGRTLRLQPWQQPSKHDRQIVKRALAWTDVSELQHRSLMALSGGEKQRAVVAMALAQQPRIILMDEPTTHLDMNHALEVMQMAERLNAEEGVTVFITSHDLNLAAEFCSRLLILDHGRLVADGSPSDVLKPNIIRDVYHCDVHIEREVYTGAVRVVPTRRLSFTQVGTGEHIHVIAGGASACELLRRLCQCGYRISCGVVNQGDTDAQAAEALGVEVVLEKPFSPIGVAAIDMAKKMIQGADAVIISDLPFGSGNVANLEIAEYAVSLGIPVLVNDKNFEERDYTPMRLAVAKLRGLLDSGALSWLDIPQLFKLLSRLNERAEKSQQGDDEHANSM